jgi:hypothetical protein
METDTIEDDDVAWRQRRCELRLDPGLEDAAVHRCIADEGCGDTVASQPGNKGLRLPSSEGSISDDALALQ